jgi:hypothetical protein
MPHFDSNPLKALAIQAGAAEAELDLRGLEPDSAISQVAALLRESIPGNARSYRIRFDPPAGDGAETLFLPLGRLLLAERRAGRLQSCLPLPDGTGYVIRLPD